MFVSVLQLNTLVNCPMYMYDERESRTVGKMPMSPARLRRRLPGWRWWLLARLFFYYGFSFLKLDIEEIVLCVVSSIN